MSRDPRFFEPHTLVEVTTVTFQNRYLLRPSPELNHIFVGVVGRAQRMYEMPVCGVVALSSHYHMLLVPRDAEHLADFMEHVNGNLSKEVGRLHGWEGAALWRDRFHLVPVTEEEAAQVSRLRYLLGAGVKENLVDRVAEWPGVHSGPALIAGKDLTGIWYDRTKEHAARQRREKNVDPEQFASEERIVLSPLPCWEHVSPAEYRRRVEELVSEIDKEGARERERTGRPSLGVKRILRARPHRRPRVVEKSPKPRFHAIAEDAFKRWREAYQEVIQAFRLASEQFREGDRAAEFPEGTFPCALPFVPFLENLMLEARGQPA